MKKRLLILTLLGMSFVCKAQNASVEKSTFGIQAGVVGMWGHNEARLSRQIALRTEIGLESGIFGRSEYDGTGYLLAPALIVEPKWYYNLNKRSADAKNISGNSGNFIALKTSYKPDWFVISNYDYINIVNQLAIIPSWGIRRNIGDHFNFETGFGGGIRYLFAERDGLKTARIQTALDLRFRVGYRF